jgi:hypothetical protein
MPLKINGYTGLSKPLDHNEPFVFESDDKTAEVEINLQLSMQEKLARAIDKEMNSKKSSKSRTPKEITSSSIVKKDYLFSKSKANVKLILRDVMKT